MLRIALILLLLGSSAFARIIEVGVRGGVPFTGSFNASGVFKDASRNWLVGPTVELRLPFGLGAEFDALYRKVAVTTTAAPGLPEATASQWQFPLLAKYRFPGIVLHPFIAGGVVFNSFSYPHGVGAATGFALGAGGELKFPKVRIIPEIRFTRIGNPAHVGPDIKQSQASLLLGITF